VYGDGTIVRDYVYAGDVADAVCRCLTGPRPAPGAVHTFNVGSSVGVSLNSVIETIERITGRSLSIDRRPARLFDCHYNVLDCAAIRRSLGWQPRVPLDEGLRRTWGWIQQIAHERSM
jgi:UDP-glucose 4-epimerase